MLLPLDVFSLVLFSLSTSTAFSAIPLASATLVNVTIDDTFGDERTGIHIAYSPQALWNLGQNCSDCTAKPDPTLVRNGSWHDGTFAGAIAGSGSANVPLSATVSFEGSAIYVFCIVTHSLSSPDGNSNMQFLLDGDLVGSFVQPPTGDSTYEYNVPVYANDSLPSGEHTIEIVNGQANAEQSLILLDYIVYSRDETSSTTSEGLSTTSFTSTSISSSLAISGGSSAISSGSNLASGAVAVGAMGSSTSSRNRTIIIATVVSLVGLLLIVAVIGLVIYCGRRRGRYGKYKAPTGGRGVLGADAAPIDADPGTSGWAEGTWSNGETPLPLEHERGRSISTTGKRKRGPSNADAQDDLPYLPAKQQSLPASAATAGFQAFHILPAPQPPPPRPPREDPISPTSSFGNMGVLPPPDLDAYPPPPVPPLPPAIAASTAHRYPYANPSANGSAHSHGNGNGHAHANGNGNAGESGTFLDMGARPVSVYTDADALMHTHPHAQQPRNTSRDRNGGGREGGTTLAAHNAHPFATAQAFVPAAYPRRAPTVSPAAAPSNTHASTSASSAPPPPSASASALAAATRGPTRKRSGSNERLTQQGQIPRSGSNERMRDPPGRAAAASPAPSSLVLSSAGATSTVTTPTSATALLAPRRTPSQPLRAPRRVDPVDPSIHAASMSGSGSARRGASSSSRERELERARQRELERHRQLERERERARAIAERRGDGNGNGNGDGARAEGEREGAAALGRRSASQRRRQGMLLSDRQQQQFGFLDVPKDAAADSRPPSYRDNGRG